MAAEDDLYDMNNSNIILSERLRLLEEGKIKSTGRLIILEHDGLAEQVPEPEEMHTFQICQDRYGRQVFISHLALGKCFSRCFVQPDNRSIPYSNRLK